MKFALFVVVAFAAAFLILGVDSGADPERLAAGALHQFSHARPLRGVVRWALGFALTAFLAGMATGDYSWVDRLWSTLPVAFAWYYAWRGSFNTALIAGACLVTLWGVRLTWNFAMKGGYAGSEDYRWAILRQRIRHPLAWQAFNLLFISIVQVGCSSFTAPLERWSALPMRASALGAELGLFGLGLRSWRDHRAGGRR
jgi:hypothetical protein